MWAPLTLTAPKKRPSRLSGATRARSALVPEWELKPLTTQVPPRRSSSVRAGEFAGTRTKLR